MASMIDMERLRGKAAATHRTGRRGGGGMDETQRRLGVVESTVDAVRTDTGEIRTDVGAIKAEIPHLATKAEVQQVRTDIAAFQAKMIQWFIGTAITMTTAIFALIKLTQV